MDDRTLPISGGKRMLLMLTSLALVASLAFVITSSSQAEAYCTGLNSNSVLSRTWGREQVRWATTCDGLEDYFGQVNDRISDGFCVYARYTVAGVWTNSPSECTTGEWRNFSYIDDDGHSWIKICKSSGGGCSSHVTNQGF